MKIPKKLKVGGHTYTVLNKYKFVDRSDRCGQSDHDTLEIKLAHLTQNGFRRSESCMGETFIHELLHCADITYNSHLLTEEMVERLANGLWQILSDNDLLK